MSSNKPKSKPKPRKTVKILQSMVNFGGREHPVYGREDSMSRAIFPREDLHPEFAQAEPGTEFTIYFRGNRYIAVKRRKWHEFKAGPPIPCLVWQRKKKDNYRVRKVK